MPDHSLIRLTLAGARIVTPAGVIEGALDIEEGLIAAIRPGAAPPGSTDLAGDRLIPGIASCLDA